MASVFKSNNRFPTRVRILILLVLAVMVGQSVSFGDVTKLRPEDPRVLQDPSRFHEIHSATNLPPQVVSLCADHNGRLAEPGKKWLPTDVITDDSLPRRRLIWAASDGQFYVVHYEQGGYAHSYHVLVAKFNREDSKAEPLWRGAGKPLKDYKAFLTALESNSMSDESGK
jgi:hypothetical protein